MEYVPNLQPIRLGYLQGSTRAPALLAHRPLGARSPLLALMESEREIWALRLLAPMLPNFLDWDDFFLLYLYAEVAWPGDDADFLLYWVFD